jgi:hypothetical protein
VGDIYKHTYTVAPADLSSDATLVDGVSGWEEYIVLDAAIKCLAKEQSSTATATLERQLERMSARLDEMAENRTVLDAGSIAHDSTGMRFDPSDYFWAGPGF